MTMHGLTPHDWSHGMNPHLINFVATERIADLARSAEQARRVSQTAEPGVVRDLAAPRTIIRLRRRGAAGQRLRVRRA
jgi:hypothetical protein